MMMGACMRKAQTIIQSPYALSHVLHAHSFTSSWKIVASAHSMHQQDPVFLRTTGTGIPIQPSNLLLCYRHSRFCFIFSIELL